MYIQIDSKFSPFTYDEMVKPLLQYKEAYEKAEAEYTDLATQTEAWRDSVNRENSPEAFEMFQRYSGDLDNIINDFSKGMTASNRRALIGMKRRYAQDILPIAKASEALKEANKFRAEKGPDAIFEVSEYNSIDDFLHGKTANNKYQSKEALTKKTAAITEAAMAEALKDPDVELALENQAWEITQHTGGSYADLAEALKLGMLDSPLLNNKFSEIRQRMAKESGLSDYDMKGQQDIMDAIDTGLYAGLDKPTKSYQNNANFMSDYQKESLKLQQDNAAMSRLHTEISMIENGFSQEDIDKIKRGESLTDSDWNAIYNRRAKLNAKKTIAADQNKIPDARLINPMLISFSEGSPKAQSVVKDESGDYEDVTIKDFNTIIDPLFILDDGMSINDISQYNTKYKSTLINYGIETYGKNHGKSLEELSKSFRESLKEQITAAAGLSGYKSELKRFAPNITLLADEDGKVLIESKDSKINYGSNNTDTVDTNIVIDE